MSSSRLAPTLLLLSLLLVTGSAHAGESLEELPLNGLLYAANRQSQGVLFYARGMQVTQDVEPMRTELRARAKRSRTGSDHEKDCRAALQAVLADLHDQAVAKRYDLLINLHSIWRDKEPSQPGVYTCAVGTLLVAVELKGTAYRAKRPAPAPEASAREPAPASHVTITEGAVGKTYSVLLGTPAVGAKLQATPDAAPDDLHLALAFRAKDAETPHKGCALGVTAGTETLTPRNTRYERGATQETLFGTLTLSQAERLAAQDGALTACETRVQLTGSSRVKISALVAAIKAHLKGVQTVQRGAAVSL